MMGSVSLINGHIDNDEMTYDEIVEALERYIEESDGFYATDVLRQALSLINRQKENYEALKAQEEKSHQYCKNVCEPKYKA